MDRRQLFQFQMERIEHVHASSGSCGPDRVVIVADATDQNAVNFVSVFLSPADLERIPKETPTLAPTIVFAVQREASFLTIVRQFFPQIADILGDPCDAPHFFVLILSDGWASATTHRQP